MKKISIFRTNFLCLEDMREIDELKIDRSLFEVVDMGAVDELEDIKYWLSRSPLERLEGIEAMRQSMYSYDPISERLPRFFEIIRPS
ncbi:MAG: hypothetical protein O7C75_02130 [Verrucomicrobia bacterium]|nr:hypothetical protein [Verrucomicrobiota bacterium]